MTFGNRKPHDRCIQLTGGELQSNLTRVDLAEGLILQLPSDHDGRNTWLLNYGKRDAAKALQALHGVQIQPDTARYGQIQPDTGAISTVKM